ncbi:MAG TPA: hypothetical protein PKA05_01675 [Roseiflexaceae bacterium]|mgnify:CR=1 FL=1|nr:hypothetical protein [Roseiflexaceae bacterium]HMP39066.1 hypothetical protein [Roseiflexaceae bacterium]
MYTRQVLIALLVLAGVLIPAPAAATPRVRCFPQTNQCISGVFLDYWEQHGGLAVFGYPITPVIPNETVESIWVGPTQWFERDRLEDHGAQGILAGRLGAHILEADGRSWYDFPQVWSAAEGCAYFEVTRHSLCEPFLSYWRTNGGLERFGYPLSEPMTETVEHWTGTVQYFERRRMEHHRELSGTPYAVLLGRLGADLLSRVPPARCDIGIVDELVDIAATLPFRAELGCPRSAYRSIPASFQRMEFGQMIWMDLGADGRFIYVSFPSIEPGHPTIYAWIEDTWREGIDPINYFAPSTRSDIYPPQRGFGKAWQVLFRRSPATPGFGVEPEQPAPATVQRFSSGALIIWNEATNQVYAFGRQRSDVAQRFRALPRR